LKNRERKRERYLKDPLPIRLAGLAASLARITSSSRRPTGGEAVEELLEECQYYIEWTAAEAEPEIAGELVNIQILISLWRKIWENAQHYQTHRTLLSVQSKIWSDQVLGYAGM
jgi:hypothetical protein